MMSLKHPFDATSMEGLLNKIVKSQPAPLPKHYSIELRTVVDSLLSKQPTKRPTVNSLLKLPFLAQYVQRLLSPSELAGDFSGASSSSHASAPAPAPVPVSGHRASDMPSVRHNGAVSNVRERERERALPPPQVGIKAKQPQTHLPAIPPTHPQQPSARDRDSYHVPASAYEHKDPTSRGSASPYYGQQPPSSHPQRPLSSHRPPPSAGGVPVPVSVPSSVPPSGHGHHGVVPPSPYAGLSNADKIRMIREKKEAELREARRQQEELTRRRIQHQQQQQPAHHRQYSSQYDEEKYNADESDRHYQHQQHQRELEKERQMRAAAAGPQLPPALRHPPLVGIKAVSRGSHAPTPLHGLPHNDRLPASRQQQQQLDQARRAREEEVTRMRVQYFKDRKVKRETKLKELSHAPQPSYALYTNQAQHPQPRHVVHSVGGYAPGPVTKVPNPYDSRPSSSRYSNGVPSSAAYPSQPSQRRYPPSAGMNQRGDATAAPRWR